MRRRLLPIGHAEAAFERLGVELAVGVGEGGAVGVDPTRQFQPAPANSHETSSVPSAYRSAPATGGETNQTAL